MKYFYYRGALRCLLLGIIACGTLMFCSMATATGAKTPEKNPPAPEQSRPGPIGLAISGASAGITTEYFELAVIDALVASGIFSDVDDSGSGDVTMRMMRVDSVFSSTEISTKTPYFLTIRVTRVDTPSFSIRMTVNMNTIWTLYRTADKTELMHETVYSTYTGGMFEGGFSGANRVRVAMEGAERESIRMGIELLASLDLEQETGSLSSLEN